MNNTFTCCLYGFTVVLLLLSLINSRTKTVLSLQKAGKMFWAVLPQFLSILILMGLLIAAVPRETIQAVIGAESGAKGILLAATLGSVAIIPALIAFPISAELLKNGAGLVQIAVFISTLTTVGFMTMPLEINYLGRKVTLLRNLLALISSFIAAFLIGMVLG